ncbi:MAG: AMP-binding protein, partial [Pseudomonadales bacterium]|nr:AMP-binding protein [Pseudomonadales bacterium]
MALISLSRIIEHWAGQQPDAIALKHEDETLTWSELERSTNRLARAYEALGVNQDDFVTVALPTGVEFFQACFSVWTLGATP